MVSHSLCMRKAPSSNLGSSILFIFYIQNIIYLNIEKLYDVLHLLQTIEDLLFDTSQLLWSSNCSHFSIESTGSGSVDFCIIAIISLAAILRLCC